MSGTIEKPDLVGQVAAIAALKDPVRRALYLHVAGRPEAVSRQEAASRLRVSRALAAFHLDKLVELGLLEAHYRRLTGRTGPGAGRPAKLYRLSSRQLDLTLPPRRYELVAQLFAQALATASPLHPPRSLERAARRLGEELAAEAQRRAGSRPAQDRLLRTTESVLRDYGFEPQRRPGGTGGTLRLRNCPFDALAKEHRGLVCGMNLCLMQALIRSVGIPGTTAVLAPQPGMCCVEFTSTGRAPRRARRRRPR